MDKKTLKTFSKSDLVRIIIGQQEIISQHQTRIEELERYLKAFDNAHTPSSKKRKKNTGKRDENKARFPGKPKGGNGGGIQVPPPDKIEEHKLTVCPISGLPLGKPVGYRKKIVIDFPDKPIQVVEHRIMQYISPVTGEIIEAKVDLPSGLYGQNLKSIVAMLKNLTNSHAKIAAFIRELGAPSFSDAEVQNIADAFSSALAPTRQQILDEIRKELHIHGDETPFRRDGCNGYIWGVFTKTRAVLLASLNRGRANIKVLLGNYKGVMVSDGYNGYDEFESRHRCWAHLDRDFEESAQDNEEIFAQYQRFEKLYKHGRELKAKESLDNLPIDNNEIDNIKWAFWDIITCLKPIKAARKIRTLMENGGENWFTAYHHIGVPLDNNLAERGLRPIVCLRNVIGCYRNDKGKHWIENVISVLQTWKLQNKNIYQGLRTVAI